MSYLWVRGPRLQRLVVTSAMNGWNVPLQVCILKLKDSSNCTPVIEAEISKHFEPF